MRGEADQTADCLAVAAHENETLQQRIDRVLEPDRIFQFRDLRVATPEYPFGLLPDKRSPVGASVLKAIAVPHGESSDSGQKFPSHYTETISDIDGYFDQPERLHLGSGLARGDGSLPRQCLHWECDKVIWDRVCMRAMHNNRITSAAKCRCHSRTDLRGLFRVHAGEVIYDPASQSGVGFHDETPHLQGGQKRLRRMETLLIKLTSGKADSVCFLHSLDRIFHLKPTNA